MIAAAVYAFGFVDDTSLVCVSFASAFGAYFCSWSACLKIMVKFITFEALSYRDVPFAFHLVRWNDDAQALTPCIFIFSASV